MKVLQGKRILIVEDDALNRLVFRLALNKAGATVEFDGGGNETLCFLQQRMPADLILLDLMLPHGQSGYALFQELRENPVFAKTPIVAVSATDPAVGSARARSLGFDGFFAKPLEVDRLARDLALVLEGHSVWPDGVILPASYRLFSLETGPLKRVNHGTAPLLRTS